jgi:hypothetical protein
MDGSPNADRSLLGSRCIVLLSKHFVHEAGSCRERNANKWTATDRRVAQSIPSLRPLRSLCVRIRSYRTPRTREREGTKRPQIEESSNQIQGSSDPVFVTFAISVCKNPVIQDAAHKENVEERNGRRSKDRRFFATFCVNLALCYIRVAPASASGLRSPLVRHTCAVIA